MQIPLEADSLQSFLQQNHMKEVINNYVCVEDKYNCTTLWRATLMLKKM